MCVSVFKYELQRLPHCAVCIDSWRSFYCVFVPVVSACVSVFLVRGGVCYYSFKQIHLTCLSFLSLSHTHTHSHVFPFKWSVEVLVSRLKCLRNSESSARECSKGVCVCTSICICRFNATPGLAVASVWQKTLETSLCDLHKIWLLNVFSPHLT